MGTLILATLTVLSSSNYVIFHMNHVTWLNWFRYRHSCTFIGIFVVITSFIYIMFCFYLYISYPQNTQYPPTFRAVWSAAVSHSSHHKDSCSVFAVCDHKMIQLPSVVISQILIILWQWWKATSYLYFGLDWRILRLIEIIQHH